MFGSDILEVAIGLVFMLLLASLICTAIKEGIESFLRRRSFFLKMARGELLNRPNEKAVGNDWVSTCYQHPLISSLYPGAYDPGNQSNCPSYIPATAFASVAIEMVGREAAASDPTCKFDVANPLTSFKPRGVKESRSLCSFCLY